MFKYKILAVFMFLFGYVALAIGYTKDPNMSDWKLAYVAFGVFITLAVISFRKKVERNTKE